MTGTFKVIATAVGIDEGWTLEGGGLNVLTSLRANDSWGVMSPWPSSGVKRLHVDSVGACWALNGANVATGLIDADALPSGFVITACSLEYVSGPGTSYGAGATKYWHVGDDEAAFGTPLAFDFSFLTPLARRLAVEGAGWGITVDFTTGDGYERTNLMRLEGTYIIELWWWNVTTGEYLFGEDPGAGWVEVAYPTPVIDSLTPDSGPIAGGTAFTILGDGFLGPDGTPAVEGVIFDGEFPATSVVVVSQHQITGVTPAHWKGGVPVVVTLDFTP